MKVGIISTMPTNHAASEVMLPSDELAALLPSGWPLEFPLARVRTCGTLAVEVLIDLHPEPDGRLQAIYGPPAASLFSIKGMTTALVLLALLASQPGGFASKDFLIQTLAHLRQSTLLDEENDWEDVEPLTRLDNVVSLLRKLLYPPKLLAFSGANRLRKHLVRFVRATQDSGPGYRLAGFPLLWLDVEAMETYITRARQLEARGEDGLEEWQAAYQIGMRGAFLAHEPYSDWADWRRGRVTDLLWQSVDAQWKRAASWDEGTNGREAAIRLLLEFWQTHMTNEDAFRSLVELLGKQERFGQAEQCYRQLCTALDREGRLPQKRTQETMAFLRLTQDRQEGHHQALLLTSSLSHSLMAEETDVRRGEGTSQEASAASGNEAETSRILPETRHLIGREAWLRGVSQMVQAFPAKKLVILQGPIGVGKSSELARLAYHFQHAERSSYRVIWLSLPAAEWSSGPETTLDVLLGTLLSECGIASFPSEAPRERLIAAFLAHLKQQICPTVMLLDNAECLLEENGALAPCWEAFLTRFVRSRHQATFLLATKEWHGWPGRESIFVAETFVPPLSPDESAILLQRLGLDAVPTELLQTVGVQMAGIPLLLEWTARLVADPLLLDDWAGLDESEAILQASTTQESIIGRLQRLLDDPSLLGEHLASRLAPFLQRIVEKRLSEEARLALIRLAVAAVPLGKPALQTLCPRPRLLKELRDASLLAAYTNRVQLLPVVALTVQQQLSSAQRQEAEILAIQAYTRWLNDGNLEMREAGRVVAELTVLLLMHYRFMEAAELLIRLGWLSFQCGYGARLALLAEQMMKQGDWQSPLERWSGGTLLSYLLRPFLGKGIDTQQRTIDYQAIYDFVCTGKIKVRASTEVMLTHYIMLSALNNDQFVEAQQALELCCHRLEPLQSRHVSTRASVLGKQGMLLSHWSEYLEDQCEKQAAREKREQAILIYQQFIHLLETHNEPSLLHHNSLKKQHAYALHYLGYHLYKIGYYEKALQSLQQSMALQKQGYGGLRGLSACFGDTILTLAALGRFREALALDEKASVEVRRLADLGHAFAKQECWFHNVNRGCLYLRLGRIEEAEQLLREALPHITIDRRAYRMFAQEALDEIERWRRSSTLPHHQLDWRWVERYRSLASYDTYWWLGSAGPLTEEEQREWDRLFPRQKGGDAKEHLGKLMAQSTRRELHAALDEHREPRLSYPTIDIEEVRSRISGLQQLDKEISQEEPNAIVRRLYHDALEEELDTLCLIEAVYENNSEDFQTLMYRLIPPPTPEEMQYALSSVRREIIRGLSRTETKQASERLIQILHEQCHLSFDLSYTEEEAQELFTARISPPTQSEPKVTAYAAKRFFEATFQEMGFDGWQVVIDPNATSARVEQGLRRLFLVNNAVSVKQIKHLLLHELAGHIMRCLAGEHSLLGLLGIHTKNSLETEEGLAIYYDIQEAMQRGEKPYETRLWSGTLATGLACGIITPAHTFRMLYTFLETLFFLRRRLRQLDVNEEIARKRARNSAMTHCLSTFRGVPDLTKARICFTQGALYLRGLWKIEQALKEDKDVLDRLAVGVVAVDDLPHLRELGIMSVPQPLRKLAEDPQLESYIRSFEQAEEHKNQSSARKEVGEP